MHIQKSVYSIYNIVMAILLNLGGDAALFLDHEAGS